jgi:hypothetical protein
MKWTSELDAALRERHAAMTRQQIADELGLTEGQVRSRFFTLGVTGKMKPWSDDDVDRLKKAYGNASVSSDINLAGLSMALGRDTANVCRKARALGLTDARRRKVLERKPTRMFSNAADLRAHKSATAKASIARNGHPRGSLGMRHTAEAKERISAMSREFWAAMTPQQRDDMVFKRIKAKRDAGIAFANPRGTWKAAWRDIGDQRCFFRSRWEANYARYLEWLRSIGQIAKWEHEPHTFWFDGIKRGVVSYLPDFRVTENGGSVQWHEVKGWMDDRSKTTIARMKRYHPNEVLVVIQEKQYKEIGRKVSILIPGWES